MPKLIQRREAKIITDSRQFFRENLIGQHHVVNGFMTFLNVYYSGLKDPNSICGSMFLLGPTGVGKTEFAKLSAYPFFDTINVYDPDRKAPVTLIKCSEYLTDISIGKLLGGDPGYVGYDDEAKGEDRARLSQGNIGKPYVQLMSQKLHMPNLMEELEMLKMEKRVLCNCSGKGSEDDKKINTKKLDAVDTLIGPIKSVIVFDEIEKVGDNPALLNILLQILDEAELGMGNGNTTYFNNSLIFFTSNLDQQNMQKILSGKSTKTGFGRQEELESDPYGLIAKSARNSVEEFLTPELIGRIGRGNFFVCYPLSEEQYRSIFEIKIRNLNLRYTRRGNIFLDFSPTAKDVILGKGYNKNYGVRYFNQTLLKMVENEVATIINNAKDDSIVWDKTRRIIIDAIDNDLEFFDDDSNIMYKKEKICDTNCKTNNCNGGCN